ncbi:immune inhibitor A domain-containing protein [Shewanella psychrotolerans]|uniref:immune inhibitor A domain-containing protein n=1 Tax=Shewanella psychrotolerans TaxID=2864206 RepID=UPI001C656257|nr:immune inhibitor A domain-containing protein [Shewanella psychrotolerans]QYK01342.1 immune inhibitor A [Shewanella psychrotolerans]
MKNQYYLGALTALSLSLMLASPLTIAAPLDISSLAPSADASVINEERILYWMIKRGELAADASDGQKRVALAAYTQRATGFQTKGLLIQQSLEKQQRQRLKQSKVARSMSFASPQADADINKTVKVLGILIDFPDLPHNNNRLSASDTDMYYPSYPTSHYNNLMFSSTGFTGPQGQNLMTGYQYYQAESGGSFFFTGSVKGWYTASQNAAYYGANDPDNNNDDTAVPELVKEAVTQALANMTSEEIASYDVEDPYDFDGDGNLDEPDGDIDHVMLFHSSIGEEAGGGVLGDDAIWSHRFFVYENSPGYTIPGTSKKVFGYTIQPIDAAAGVVVHEFGHDLGLPDEYDTSYNGDGSPVGSWSIMSGGSWTGTIAGTQPVGFSPYARSYLQNKYKGKWLTEEVLSLNDIPVGGRDVALVEAVNNTQVNQIAVKLPPTDIAFKPPYAGSYQYYSGQGDMISTAAAFSIALPVSAVLTLKMKAHWNIEQDYDYAQVMVDGVAIAGNHTKPSNTINSAKNIITGKSSDIAGAEGADSWVDLIFDLSGYAGSNRQISIVYFTDQAVGDYGLVVDEIKLLDGTNEIYSDGAETEGKMTLTGGFARIDNNRPGKDRRYLVQLRSYNGVDAGLASHSYEPGVLLWLEDFNEADNNSSEHPGSGLIGVVDADQNLISSYGSAIQIRDATFSMFNQSTYFNDNHLTANNLFDDSQDYSAPLQPQSGIILPALGLTMEVVAQNNDSSTATVRFKYRGEPVPPEPAPDPVTVSISAQQTLASVSFSANVTGGYGDYSYAWEFGVPDATSTLVNPTYVYSESNEYTVSLTVTDGLGARATELLFIYVEVPPTASFSFVTSDLRVTFSDSTSAGVGELSYQWTFGDGSSSSEPSPVHTYSQAGSYTVTLTVTDAKGYTSVANETLVVTTAVVVPPVVEPPAVEIEKSSGGGSLGWLSLSALFLLALRRRA